MPFNSNKDLVDKVNGTDKLSPRKQRQFRHVFNNCHDENGDDPKCYAMAWSVVKKTAGLETFREIHDREDPDGTNHDLRLICIQCGDVQTCRCSKPKREFRGICHDCAKLHSGRIAALRMASEGNMVFPPDPVKPTSRICVFLAGSIDMGKAVDWQTDLAGKLDDTGALFLNPRRVDWDSSWEQNIRNDQFREQVEWELDGLDRADIVALYFDPKGQAPISLLELGLHAQEGKVVVYCPKGYWRKGNVEVVCKRFGIPLYGDYPKFVDALRDRIRVRANERKGDELNNVKTASIEERVANKNLLKMVKRGDLVTIRTPQGQKVSGKAVMKGPHGWVLNMGGRHGRPGVADERNIVEVKPRRG